MCWLLITVALLGGVGLTFHRLGGAVGAQGLRTLPLWAGACCVGASYWFFPWVRLDPTSTIETFVPSGELVTDLLDVTGLNEMIAGVASWTGWGVIQTAEAIPLLPTSFLVRVYAPWYLALAGLATTAAVILRPRSTASRVLGALLGLGSAIGLVLLLLALPRIRTFGVLPGVTSVLAHLAGLRLSWGIWAVVAGLASMAVGGAIAALPMAAPAARRGVRPPRGRPRSPRRSGKVR